MSIQWSGSLAGPVACVRTWRGARVARIWTTMIFGDLVLFWDSVVDIRRNEFSN